ncbi:hypothetical protein [Tautonia marina]|uniref:hypothetical protein n=1 Tax=Tautonia marina TaxID=2653855 RepID=UPI001260CD2B|nr:hypothetical protein [Tautonia marina]
MADERMAEKFSILDMIDRKAGAARSEPERPEPVAPEAAPAVNDDHPPLPVAGDPYRAYSRLSSRPVACLFFLPKNMLPVGFLYHGLERVWMAEGERPGSGPKLIVRFSGSEVTEAVIEGRNLIPLCAALGRMAIYWVWEQPANQPAEDDAATVIRSITFRKADG